MTGYIMARYSVVGDGIVLGYIMTGQQRVGGNHETQGMIILNYTKYVAKIKG